MRSVLPVGGTRARVDRVARMLFFFGNRWNDRLNDDRTGIVKTLCFLVRCGSRVIAFFVDLEGVSKRVDQ